MNLPNEVISIVFSFLDGNSLLNCENVSKFFYELTDNLHFWKRAVKAQFPLLHNDDIITYSGEWKKLFLDKNKQNHSTSFEWKIDKFSTKTERQISPTFTLKNHTFNLIVDPMGKVYFIIIFSKVYFIIIFSKVYLSFQKFILYLSFQKFIL